MRHYAEPHQITEYLDDVANEVQQYANLGAGETLELNPFRGFDLYLHDGRIVRLIGTDDASVKLVVFANHHLVIASTATFDNLPVGMVALFVRAYLLNGEDA